MPDAAMLARPSTAGSTVSRATTTASRSDAKEEIWSTMLSSVSATKAIPLKNVFILGGGATGAQEFVESLMRVQGAEKKSARQRKHTQAPLTTELALGYTYLDIEDAEHEDILTRLGLYSLPAPAPSYEPILAQAVAASPISDNLLLILLDWATPWTWLSEIRQWVQTLKRVTGRIRESDALAEEAMDRLIEDWEMRIRNYTENARATTATSEAAVSDVALPLSSGQFDDPLGLPLMVVCHNADKTESIAREANFKDEQFDFIQQYLRTVLLKHGAGLHYTTPFLTETTSTLFNAIQSAFSLPTAAPAPKANVIARDAVVIPFGWDSWGKIRVLREGFDLEGVHAGWAIDLKEDRNDTEAGAIEIYEDVIKDPKQASSAVLALGTSDSITHCAAEQDFLTEQLKILEKKASESKEAPSSASQMSASSNVSYTTALGSVSFNVGGIQVDADDVDERLRRLKDRKSLKPSSSEVTLDGIDGSKAQTEVLQNFFNSLLTKKANKPTTSGGSPARSSSKDVPPRSSRSDKEAR
ncbi:hypothetical protein YB2330_005013 [Saitoella coloradoensis]